MVWLLLATCLHIFGNQFSTRVVLYSSIIVPIVLCFIAWFSARRVIVGIETPGKIIKSQRIEIAIDTKGGWFVGLVKCCFVWENLLTGEHGENELEIGATVAQKDRKQMMVLDENEYKHCGVFTFRLTAIRVMDLLGISAWKVRREPSENMPVMPIERDMFIEIPPGENASPEAQEYSNERPGSDISETFAIREYRPGDPIKSIHWKLSGKTDKLLVREYGLPVDNNILILMESGCEAEPGFIDAMASDVYNKSCKLVLMGLPHTIGWLNTETGKLDFHQVVHLEDTEQAFIAFASNTAKDIGIGAFEALGTHEFSHVFVERGDG